MKIYEYKIKPKGLNSSSLILVSIELFIYFSVNSSLIPVLHYISSQILHREEHLKGPYY